MLVESWLDLNEIIQSGNSENGIKEDLFEYSAPLKTTKHQCFENKDPDLLQLPIFVVPNNDDLETFFADIATYHSSISPVSSYIHVCSNQTAKNLLLGSKKAYKANKPSEHKLKLYLACVLGEVISCALRENKTLSSGVINYATCTQSAAFTMARTNILYPWVQPEYIAKKLVLAHTILKNDISFPSVDLAHDFLSLPNKVTKPVKKISPDFTDLNDSLVDFICGAITDRQLSEKFIESFDIGSEAAVISGPFNNRITAFNSLASAIEQTNLSNKLKSACIAYYCNKILPGSLNHAEVLRSKISTFPDIVFWYSIFAFLSHEFDMKTIAFGSCVKVARDLISPIDFESRPSSDISIDELEILSRLTLKASVIKPRHKRLIRVSLMPGVEVELTFADSESKDKKPDIYQTKYDSKKIRSLLFEALDLLDERKARYELDDRTYPRTTSKKREF